MVFFTILPNKANMSNMRLDSENFEGRKELLKKRRSINSEFSLLYRLI